MKSTNVTKNIDKMPIKSRKTPIFFENLIKKHLKSKVNCWIAIKIEKYEV